MENIFKKCLTAKYSRKLFVPESLTAMPYRKTGKNRHSRFRLSIFLSSVFLALLNVCFSGANAQSSKNNPEISMNEPGAGDIHAVIIGISHYNTLPDLQFADKDARIFYELLLSGAFGADSAELRLLLNENATQNKVDEAFMNIVDLCKEGDRVFIYFAGHGAIERKFKISEREYLLTCYSDVKGSRLYFPKTIPDF